MRESLRAIGNVIARCILALVGKRVQSRGKKTLVAPCAMSVTAQRMRGQRGQLTRMEFAIANSFHCELSHSRRSTFLVAPSSVSAWHQSLCRACPRGETRRVAKGAGHVAKST